MARFPAMMLRYRNCYQELAFSQADVRRVEHVVMLNDTVTYCTTIPYRGGYARMSAMNTVSDAMQRPLCAQSACYVMRYCLLVSPASSSLLLCDYRIRIWQDCQAEAAAYGGLRLNTKSGRSSLPDDTDHRGHAAPECSCSEEARQAQVNRLIVTDSVPAGGEVYPRMTAQHLSLHSEDH